MRSGFVSVRYDVSVYDNETIIEIIDYDYLVDYSGFHNTKKSIFRNIKESIPLGYQSQSFVKDEFDCHLSDELHNYVIEEKYKSGIYYTFFNFQIHWTISPSSPDGPEESDSYMEIEADDCKLITNDPSEIEQFWEDYNKGQLIYESISLDEHEDAIGIKEQKIKELKLELKKTKISYRSERALKMECKRIIKQQTNTINNLEKEAKRLKIEVNHLTKTFL